MEQLAVLAHDENIAHELAEDDYGPQPAVSSTQNGGERFLFVIYSGSPEELDIGSLADLRVAGRRSCVAAGECRDRLVRRGWLGRETDALEYFLSRLSRSARRRCQCQQGGAPRNPRRDVIVPPSFQGFIS